MAYFVYVDPTPAPPPFTASYIGSTVSPTSGTTHTFTGVSIGSAATGRVIVAGVTGGSISGGGGGGGSGGFTLSISSGTIAGSAATVTASVGTSRTAAGQLYATVASGTTATITVTFNTTVPAAAIHVFALYDTASSSPTDTASEASSSATSIDVSAGGEVIGIATNDTASVTWTNTGVVEDASANFDTDEYCVASVTSALAQTGMSVRMLPSTVLRTCQSYTAWR